MSIYSEADARAILDKVVKLSKADECTATLDGSVRGNVRFALNNISTSGIVSDTVLGVRSAYGKRIGTATTNAFDDASLERVVRRAEELARLAPENPEFMPALEKQAYKPSPTFSASVAGITPEYRAKVATDSIAPCRAGKMVAAGFLADGQSFVATANSKGNFGYQQATSLDYTCTVRTDDERGSGWVGRNVNDAGQLDAAAEVRTAMGKAGRSADARALEPGKYTVILEPEAAAGLVSFMMRYFDARQADEGRSFLSKKGGGNKLGEQVFDPRVSIHTDPWDPVAPVLPWDGEGLAREKMALVDKGRIANLEYSRYWAKLKDRRAMGSPGNILMAGGTKSTDELVRGTKKGILVTRTWYIRMVDPQTVLLTGLTRDGTFYVEDGEIRYPVKNFRFNESPVIMLNNVEELGRPVRLGSSGGGGQASRLLLIPPMKLRDFTFTSLSDAV